MTRKIHNMSHILQMLGDLNESGEYILPKDIAETLIKIPKMPIVQKDEIDIGNTPALMQSTYKVCDLQVQFCVENSILFLLERAQEMGGLIAYTYLSPLCEMNTEYFNNIDETVDLNPLCERIKKRRAQYQLMITQHERLAQSAIRRTHKMLETNNTANLECARVVHEFDELSTLGKRFIRKGKPDFYISQLQMLDFIIEKNNFTSVESLQPICKIIEKWRTKCNTKTANILSDESSTEVFTTHIPNKQSNQSPGSKAIDFKNILAGLLKQDCPIKAPTRIKPSEQVLRFLDAENEIEQEFITDHTDTPKPDTTEANIVETDFTKDEVKNNNIENNNASDQNQNKADEIKINELVTHILKKQGKSPSFKKHIKSVAKGIKQGQIPQYVPVSSNHVREQ